MDAFVLRAETKAQAREVDSVQEALADVRGEEDACVALQRLQIVDELQSWLRAVCGAVGISFQAELLHRWIMSRSLLQSKHLQELDPVLPMQSRRECDGEVSFRYSLHRSGVSETLSAELSEELFRRSQAAGQLLCRLRQKYRPLHALNIPVTLVTKTDAFFSIHLGDSFFDLSAARYEALCADYSQATENPRSSTAAHATFLWRLWLLLVRYFTVGIFFPVCAAMNDAGAFVGGAGLQAAIPNSCFRVLQSCLDVSTELFASPLNHFCGTYFSAFPDTDRYFGSRGNFFSHTKILEGSYECNPPFVEEIMLPLVLRVISWMEEADAKGKRLTVAFILPRMARCRSTGFLIAVVAAAGWEGCESMRLLQGSRFRSCGAEFKSNAHYYMQGLHYRRMAANIYHRADFPTAVIVLQTLPAYKSFPANAGFMEQFEAAFSHPIL